MSDRRAPSAAANFETLPPDVINLVGGCLLSQVSPLWDRHDVLKLACALVSVGSFNTRLLSQNLFSYLSPRLGEAAEQIVDSGLPVRRRRNSMMPDPPPFAEPPRWRPLACPACLPARPQATSCPRASQRPPTPRR
jgi:hypothetical protein